MFEQDIVFARSPAELYAMLGANQSRSMTRMSWQLAALLTLLVVALAAAGALAKTAVCLAVLAGMAWAWSMVDWTCRQWFMHHVALRDLLHPPAVSWDVVTGAAACIQRVPPEGTGEGSKTGAPDQTPPLH